jgi:hypothetical protein
MNMVIENVPSVHSGAYPNTDAVAALWDRTVLVEVFNQKLEPLDQAFAMIEVIEQHDDVPDTVTYALEGVRTLLMNGLSELGEIKDKLERLGALSTRAQVDAQIAAMRASSPVVANRTARRSCKAVRP